MNIEAFQKPKQKIDNSFSKEVPNEIDEDLSEQHAVLMGNLSLLKNTQEYSKDPKSYIEKTQVTLEGIDAYFTAQGATYHEDVMDVYRKYQTEDINPLVIRREDPNLLVDLVNGKAIEMTFDPNVVGERGDKYVNCALWPHGDPTKTTGLHNAFMEGRGMSGPIVMVAGYKNNKDHMLIENPDRAMLNVGSLHRQSVRILSGEVQNKDLAFIIVRTSARFFNQNKLTDSERSNPKLREVFRGYLFDK